MDKNVTGCAIITIHKKEKIFRGMEYDPKTKQITNPCELRPLGFVKMGKIYWYKKIR